MPATRAAASTSPLVMALLATLEVVSGFIATRHRASARRWVGSLGETSTMRAPPKGSRRLRLRSVISRTDRSRTTVYGTPRFLTSIVTRCTRLLIGAAETAKGSAGVPTYEYNCAHCDKTFDVVQSFHDDPLTECPTCGNPVRKVFGNVGVVFKGSGFYKNDSRPKESSKSSSESSSSSNGSSDSSSTATATKAPASDSSKKSTGSDGASTSTSTPKSSD